MHGCAEQFRQIQNKKRDNRPVYHFPTHYQYPSSAGEHARNVAVSILNVQEM